MDNHTRVVISAALAILSVGFLIGLAFADAPPISPQAYLPVIMKSGPTATPTPTATAVPCRPNYVNTTGSFSSTLIVGNNPVWADNEQLMQLVITLFDECGDAITDGRVITPTSSRQTLDTISLGPIVGNQYFFWVRSGVIGTSVFTATTRLEPAYVLTTTTVSFPSANPPIGQFVCMNGLTNTSGITSTLPITYTHPGMPPNRRLTYLKVEWPADGIRGLTTISLGNATNIIWNTGSITSPLEITAGQWTGVNRSITAGTSRLLEVNFDYDLSGTGAYTVTAGWDDGAGGSYCVLIPVTVTVP